MSPPPSHVHMLSMHTSPIARPGSGDAGGMNVYVSQLARRLAGDGVPVTLHALRRLRSEPVHLRLADGLDIHHHEVAGALGAPKEELPAHVDAFTRAVLAAAEPGPGQLVHAHYWLSGLAGLDIAAALDAPLVSCLHTSALVKNLRAAPGQPLEGAERIAGERRVVTGSQALVVNTSTEAGQMADLYGADPDRLRVIAPGVDPGLHHPPRPDLRDAPGPARPMEILMAARLQPLKGPDLLISAVAELAGRGVAVHATITGDGPAGYMSWLRRLTARLAVADRIAFVPAMPPGDLAERMRRADVVAVPSASETYGLVALEAQACATPVVASRADGLTSAVADGRTGVLVASRTPEAWADTLAALAADPTRRRTLGRAGAVRAGRHTWSVVAERTARLYADLLSAPARRG